MATGFGCCVSKDFTDPQTRNAPKSAKSDATRSTTSGRRHPAGPDSTIDIRLTADNATIITNTAIRRVSTPK